MTDEMQDNLPHTPPPPPGEPAGAVYGHWSPDPRWGPPLWPPTPHRAPRRSGLRRTLLAGFAIACVGAGGGTAWALTTTAVNTPAIATIPGSSIGSGEAPNSTGDNPNGSAQSTGGPLSAETLARLDSSIVDINSNTAVGTGQVAGTGMIISSNGYVLTNNHVIDGTVNITAQINGTGTVYKVKVIGYDLKDDVALVQLQGASNLPVIPIGDSSRVSPGDQITVLGNALGKGGTPAQVTGIVAQLDQPITASDDSGDTETLTGMIQVSAAIEPGDSGGPEVNASGQVIGMTTAGSTSGNPGQETGSTTGFAIPINKAMQIAAEIRSGSGPNIHIGNAALLGVKVTANPAASNGAHVEGVNPGTPAATAGIVAGDVIVKVGTMTISSSNDLHNAMASLESGQSVVFVWTDPATGTHTASITLAQAAFPD